MSGPCTSFWSFDQLKNLGNRRMSHYFILKPIRKCYEIEYKTFSEIKQHMRFWDLQMSPQTVLSLGKGNQKSEEEWRREKDREVENSNLGVEGKSKNNLRVYGNNLSCMFSQKIKLSKGETSLDHCPTKISLCEDHLLHKTQGNFLCFLKRHLIVLVLVAHYV